MNQKHTKKMYLDFPDLYHENQLPYGFECLDGWFDLIHGLSEKIAEYISAQGPFQDFSVVQIKQEFGSLRYYVEGADETIRGLIRDAEEQSKTLCEMDGQPADGLYVCAPRWYRYLCGPCAEIHSRMSYEEYLRQTAQKKRVH
jgi:hypothetical protein